VEAIAGNRVSEGIRNVDEEVRRLLGLDFDAFTQAVMLPQGSFAEFLRCQPAERRQMLVALLRLQVYQRMREKAAAASADHGSKKDNLQRRLDEDFLGVSREALEKLQGRHDEVGDQLAAAETLRKELAEGLAAAQADHERTRDLAAGEERLQALQGRHAEMEALQALLANARRAAGVVPLLDQAGQACKAAEQRDGERALAEQDAGRLEGVQGEAIARFQRAEQAAVFLPNLLVRQMQLAEVGALACVAPRPGRR